MSDTIVTAQVTGGAVKRVRASTVGEVQSALQLNGAYTALVNGEPADQGTQLRPSDHVTFAAQVKGGEGDD